MSQTSQTLNTLNHVQALLAKDSKTIMKRENINGNRVHLYDVGQYGQHSISLHFCSGK